MNKPFALVAPLALAACTVIPQSAAVESPAPTDGIARAAIGQRVYVDGPYVTPSVRIDLGSRSETHEIGSDQPIQVADGQLSLVEVRPDTLAGQTVEPAAYRFGFTFAGGL